MTERCYAECRYAECRYAECRYAECLYAECLGAFFKGPPIKHESKKKILLFIKNILSLTKLCFQFVSETIGNIIP